MKQQISSIVLALTLMLSTIPAITADVTITNDHYFDIGQSKELFEKVVTLDNVGSTGNVQVTVGDITKVVEKEGETEVNGLTIEVATYTYSDSPGNRHATLTITQAASVFLPAPGINEHLFLAGDSKELYDKTITLNNVGNTGNVQVTIGDNSYVIENGETETIQNLQITIKNYNYDESVDNRWALLHIIEDEDISLYNLKVEEIYLYPENPESSDTLTIIADVRNEADSAEEVEVRAILLDEDASRLLEEEYQTKTLAAQSGKSVFTFSFPLTETEAGQEYLVQVEAAYTANITEEDDEDNRKQEELEIATEELPDLTPTALFYQQKTDTNQYTFSATVENEGDKASGAFTVQLLDNNMVRDTKTVSSLYEDATQLVTFKALALATGNHDIKVIVDPYNTIREEDEDNNEKVREVYNDVQNHEENRPSVELKAVENKVEEGEEATFKLIIKDNHKDDDEEYRYTLSSTLRYANDLPGFVDIEGGEEKELLVSVDTSELRTSPGYSNDILKKLREEYFKSHHPFTITVTPEQTQYRVIAWNNLYFTDEDLPVPPVLPAGNKVTIELEEGWNLVSVPGKLVSFQKTSCKPKPLGYVWVDEKDEYLTLKEAQRYFGGDFKTYMSTHSFWVYSYEECNLRMNVKEENTNTNVVKGWNFLPVKYGMLGQSLSDLANTKHYTSAYWFDAEEQEWDSISKSETFKTSHIGQGFVLKAKNKFTFGSWYDDTIPPTLPGEDYDYEDDEDDD